jgi:Tfp pilus assembly protein PilF
MESLDAKEMFLQGMFSFSQGDFRKSIDDLSRALESDPEYILAHITRGVAYMKTDRTDLAVGDFDKVIEADPEYARAYHLRGVAYSELGEPEKSLQDFDKAIELNPEYGAAYLSRANIHEEMGHDQEAQEDMEMVRRLQEMNVQGFAEDQNILNIKDG